MLKRFMTPQSPFEFYFKEAPGDDEDKVSVTVAPRKNRGTDYDDDGDTVTVAPRANRGTDYDAEDEPADAPVDDTEPAEDAPTDDTPDTGDDEPTDYSDGAPEDEPADDAAGDAGADGDAEGDEPYTGGDDGATDYSDETSGDDAGEGEESEPPAEEQTEEEKEEASKKYHMYKRFVHLYNVVESFLTRCRSIVFNDPVQNTVIKTVINNFSDIYENMYDYMTIKYKTATYVQILIYFETIISAIRLNFELMRNNKINLKQ